MVVNAEAIIASGAKRSPAIFSEQPVAIIIALVLTLICLLAPSNRPLKSLLVMAAASGAESKRVPVVMLSSNRQPSPSSRKVIISFRCSVKSVLSEAGAGGWPVAIVPITFAGQSLAG
jgi:hypothetical protein